MGEEFFNVDKEILKEPQEFLNVDKEFSRGYLRKTIGFFVKTIGFFVKTIGFFVKTIGFFVFPPPQTGSARKDKVRGSRDKLLIVNC